MIKNTNSSNKNFKSQNYDFGFNFYFFFRFQNVSMLFLPFHSFCNHSPACCLHNFLLLCVHATSHTMGSFLCFLGSMDMWFGYRLNSILLHHTTCIVFTSLLFCFTQLVSFLRKREIDFR